MSLYTLESDSPTGSEAEWDEFPNTDHLADGMCPSCVGPVYVTRSSSHPILCRAQRIIELPPRLLRQRFLELCEDGTCDWVDSSGRIVLLGDAAHPSIVSTHLGHMLSYLTTFHLISPAAPILRA